LFFNIFLRDDVTELVPVRYPECCKRCLFVNWSETSPLNVSESTFRKYLPREIKKAKKATDLCPHCENFKKLAGSKRPLNEIEGKYENFLISHKKFKQDQNQCF